MQKPKKGKHQNEVKHRGTTYLMRKIVENVEIKVFQVCKRYARLNAG